MPYPLRVGMTKDDFHQEILQHYFPELCANSGDLAADYAAIGAFLTRTGEVLAALQPLEDELRAQALAKAINVDAAATQQASLYTKKEFTKKILTRALQSVEVQAGFNLARAGVLLHNNSVVGTGSGPVLDLTDHGRTQDGKSVPGRAKVDLPAGVPKIIGSSS